VYLGVDVGDVVLDDVIAQDFYFGESRRELHSNAYYSDEVDAEPNGNDYGFGAHFLMAPTAVRVVANWCSVSTLAMLVA
jgi:hypothetical protein